MCTMAAGSVRIFVALAFLSSAAVHADDQRFQRTVSADAKGQVEVSLVSGSAEITGWDQPQVSVEASYDDDEVQRIDVTSERGRVVIKVVVPRSRNGDADLKIRVPASSELEVTAVSADLRSRNMLGEQRLKSVSGSITADVAQGECETKTVSGSIVIRGNEKGASVRASSVSGDIRYERGAGELEATTVSGDLFAALKPAKDIRVRTTSGDITLTGRLENGGSVDGESISGELSVHLEAPSGFRYEANSFSGDINNCFKEEAQRVSKYGPGSRLNGDRGEGKGQVRLKTLSGGIDLCDR